MNADVSVANGGESKVKNGSANPEDEVCCLHNHSHSSTRIVDLT